MLGARRGLLGVVALLVLFALLGGSAHADRLADRQAEADRVQAQLAQMDADLSKAIEAYDAAQTRLDKTEAAIRDNAQQLDVTRRNLQLAQDELSKQLVADYRSGDPDTIGVLLGAGSMSDMLARIDIVKRSSGRTAQPGRQGAVAEEAVRAPHGDAREAAQDARGGAGRPRRPQGDHHERHPGAQGSPGVGEARHPPDHRRARGRRARRRRGSRGRGPRRTAGCSGRRDARRRSGHRRLGRRRHRWWRLRRLRWLAAAAAAVAAAPTTPVAVAVAAAVPTRRSSRRPSSGGSSVVGAALSQLGVPYKWAGASPGEGFDCSGLTMWAYAQVGVSLPHNASAQHGMGTPVDRANLQPGDLVFFNGDNHEGMYIGGGQFVHAPHTGDVVKISNLDGYPGYNGAVRI